MASYLKVSIFLKVSLKRFFHHCHNLTLYILSLFQALLVLVTIAAPSVHGATLHVKKSDTEEATFHAPETNSSGNYNVFLNVDVGGDLNVAKGETKGKCSNSSSVGGLANGEEEEKKTESAAEANKDEPEPVVTLALHGSGRIDTLPVDDDVVSLPSIPTVSISPFRDSVAGSLAGETLPVSCGGRDRHNRCSDKCYAFNPKTLTWSLRGRMNVRRCNAGASVHPNLGLVITGGFTENRRRGLASVEATRDGRRFVQLPPLPKHTTHYHCQLTVDAETIMVLGGFRSFPHRSNAVQQLDVAKKRWKVLPSFKSVRNALGCGVVKVEGVPKSVVVAGGVVSYEGTIDRVEVLDLKTLKWTSGTS